MQCCHWLRPFSQLDETAGHGSDDNAEPMRNLVHLSSKAALLQWCCHFNTVPRTTDSLSQRYHYQSRCVCIKRLNPLRSMKTMPLPFDSLVRSTYNFSVTLENGIWNLNSFLTRQWNAQCGHCSGQGHANIGPAWLQLNSKWKGITEKHHRMFDWNHI